MSKNYGKAPRRPLPPEKERPSVFERLGVRRDNSSGPYPADSTHRDSRPRVPPPEMERRGDGGRPSALLPTPKKKGTKDKSKVARLSDDMKPSDKLNKKEKKERVSGEQKGLIKKKVKKPGRTSSASSIESTDGSISTTSSSSTSSSSSDSTSDSSVPSIKLKSDKAKPNKRGKVDNNSRKMMKPQQPQNSPGGSCSGSSGIDVSTTPIKRGPGSVDLREKLNTRSPLMGKDPYGSSSKNKAMEPYRKIKPYDDRSPSMPEDDRIDRYGGGPKKRPVPPPQPTDQYQYEDIKRRRLMSPLNNKYRSPPDEMPQHHRRAPPAMHEPPQRRGRTPPQLFQRDLHQSHQQRAILSPQRRHDARRPDQNRSDFRNDNRDKRNTPFQSYNNKPDMDKRRETQADFNNRDNRGPRDRVAPSRLMDNRQDRGGDRGMDNRNSQFPDYQRRSKPLYGHDQSRPSGSNNNSRGGYDRSRPNNSRYPPPHYQNTEEKRQPLLPKSKEALAERYEQMKKSGYVDKWVDETVRTSQRQDGKSIIEERSPAPSSHSIKSMSPATSSRSKTRNANKELVIPDAEDISDFSEDDDEMLNDKPISPQDSQAGSSSEKLIPGKSPKKTESISGNNKPTSSTGDLPIKNRTISIETPTSTFGHNERLSGRADYLREEKSLPSQSQTDDILERMDFEEISDEELGEVENRVHIVDALGVDWASLVQEKPTSATPATELLSSSARKRWAPSNIVNCVGISKSLAGEELFNKFAELKKTEQSTNAEKSHVPSKDAGILERIGLGPNSRALSSRRDLAVRRYLLGLPRKSLQSLDIIHPPTNTTPEMDSVGELYKLSIALLKPRSNKVVNQPRFLV